MIEALKKGVRNFILPMYPWIVDFDVIYITIAGPTYIRINYYTDGPFEVTDEFNELETLTKSLFTMFGGGTEQKFMFDGININSIEYRD